MSGPDELYDAMRREEQHEAELDPRWSCGACGVTVEPWDRPHDHLCYVTGMTTMLPALHFRRDPSHG